MQRLIPTGLRAQISAVVVAPAIAIAVLASLASLWTLSRISSERSTEALHRATERTEMSMQASEQGMQTLALALATNPALIAAVAARDTAGLGAMMMPVYDTLLESDPRIAVFEVGGADGRVLLRAQQPERAGDDKSSSPDIRTALAGQVATGAVNSVTTGSITYGATVPLQQDGRVVGTLRVAGGIDGSMASVIAAITGGEAIVVGRGQPMGATLHGVAPDLLALLQRPDSPALTPDGLMVDVPGTGTHLVRTLPIIDLAGQPVGAIIFGLPMRDWQAAERWGTLATLGAALIGLVLAIPLALILAGRLASLIRRIAGAMSVLAGGDLSQPIPGVGRRDEVGAMAGALKVFRDKLAESRGLEDASLVARLARERRAAALEGYTQDFGQSIAGVMSQLEQASEGMKQAATRMTSVVGQTRTQASGTAGGAAEASGNLVAVASAVEQMSASVGEICRQVAYAAKVAAEAVREAGASDGRMRAVTGSADRIGD
ncbi:MAG: HAMP domain-containing protein, partial [Rubritepida sp.]|nr:HAMP domain-containing protein [Rubritepida sp.]